MVSISCLSHTHTLNGSVNHRNFKCLQKTIDKNVYTFINNFTIWVQNQADILAAALVGSYACGQARPDSDVDLVLLAAHPQDWINNPAWTSLFGVTTDIQVEVWGILTSLRVFYKDGLEVEYGIAPVEWGRLPLEAGTARVMADGMQILSDSQGLLDRAAAALKTTLPPD